MTAEPFRCNYTWPRVEGSIEKQIAVQVGESSSPDFVPLDDLLDLDKCLILSASDDQEACEMRLSIAPMYLPRAVSLVVECPVIECYHGRLNEYNRTYHGELVYTLEEVKVFRFDIRIPTDMDALQLKFISHKKEPLCLYGTRLYLVRNSDPLRTMMMMGGRKINPIAVQHRLQGTELSEKAEKCKRLIMGAMQTTEQNIENNNTVSESSFPADPTTVPVQALANETDGPTLPNLFSKLDLLAAGSEHFNPTLIEIAMKQYIDTKFVELHRALDSRLASLEARQNAKFDRILELLEDKSKPNSQEVE
uniref:Uncharacterized protein n=1 Tax=Anopheles farauti TaxID=69004 RepID=A0A182QRL6_9DIPT